VALLLGLLVVHMGLDTLARLRATQARLATRGDGIVALRVGRHTLRRELRFGVQGRDWAADSDSLALRAFRGTALVCPADSAAVSLSVAFRGDRAPDVTKDSVLLVTEGGSRTARALVAIGAPSGACVGAPPEGFVAATWTVETVAPAGAVVAMLFEHGSYHLVDGALRYRRGRSGRQPLTPEVWASTSGWITSDGHLGVELIPGSPDVGRPWAGYLAPYDTP